MKKPNIDEFFSDPKYAEDAEFTKAVFRKLMNDMIEEAKKKKKEKKETGFQLPFFFSHDDEEDDEEIK